MKSDSKRRYRMANFLKKLIENDKKELRSLEGVADKVISYADRMAALDDEELRDLTESYKERYQKGETLDDLLPEAFAVVREGAKRVLGLYPYKVQIMGGITLHKGNIAEMKTGEGKTLTATMPVYLNALSGEGVHVVTVNEYLASRDAVEMGELYRFLGLTVGLNTNGKSSEEKREAYNCDITYSTNNELGFDYLRDNMVVYKNQMVQRPLNFAVVDEVDSILIDEARTPLIISGQAEKSTALYNRADFFIKGLKENEDYTIDLTSKSIALTDEGIEKAEKTFHLPNLYDVDNTRLVHHLDQALRANYIMLVDIDYVVEDGKVKIVDQFTGRIMEGRRYSDGLHQAIEAKENVEIENESKTMATITFQNYFRMYKKLSGMTGTAKTEEEEFREIYNMNVISIPTNRPIVRHDYPDLLYPSLKSKFRAVVGDIKERHAKGQPILVGTVAVETSELLSHMLRQENIPHQVLNAKNHFREAEIIIGAGQPGAVTIATNMAGRGTDIKLQGDAKANGGLAIIGTERHDSRRVDRQLRGRAGRQGDPGSSQFYVSLEDNLMRLFGSERIAKMMDKMGHKEGEVIQHSMITKSIERAQKKVEENNFGIRKRLLEYDDVMNKQRDVIYKRRKNALFGDHLKYDIINTIYDVAASIVSNTKGGNQFKEFEYEIIKFFTMEAPLTEAEFKAKTEKEITDIVFKKAEEDYKNRLVLLKENSFPIIENVFKQQGHMFKNVQVPFSDGTKTLTIVTDLKQAYETQCESMINDFEKNICLTIIDENWKHHLKEMDDLRKSSQGAVYEQKDPLVIYKQESFHLFSEMMDKVNKEIISFLFKGEIPTS